MARKPQPAKKVNSKPAPKKVAKPDGLAEMAKIVSGSNSPGGAIDEAAAHLLLYPNEALSAIVHGMGTANEKQDMIRQYLSDNL